MGGDQLTVARVYGTQCLFRGIDKAMEHLQGIIPVQEDWHARMNFMKVRISFLPARASEQGNVIGSVHIYIYMCTKKIVIERTRDLNYLKFVATDFSPKTISPSAGENSGDLA